jgi:hypothetical protein
VPVELVPPATEVGERLTAEIDCALAVAAVTNSKSAKASECLALSVARIKC